MCDVSDVKAVFGYMRLKGIGANRTNRELMSYSRGIHSGMALADYLSMSLREEQRIEYLSLCDKVVAHRYADAVRFKMIIESSYPVGLQRMLKLNTPPVLTLLGNVGLLDTKKVGFSGSRKVSEKGLEITRDCVSQLAVLPGVSIVSGYAQGVDREAHRTALAMGGSTIVVLPNGISEFSVRWELSDVWDWDRVLVVSEYLPEDKWSVARAMNRNGTIIGLCDAMFVAEAGVTGGSLDAGLKTLADGKPLFVPRYGDWPETALGNRRLLEMGARPILRSLHSGRANVAALAAYLSLV